MYTSISWGLNDEVGEGLVAMCMGGVWVFKSGAWVGSCYNRMSK